LRKWDMETRWWPANQIDHSEQPFSRRHLNRSCNNGLFRLSITFSARNPGFDDSDQARLVALAEQPFASIRQLSRLNGSAELQSIGGWRNLLGSTWSVFDVFGIVALEKSWFYRSTDPYECRASFREQIKWVDWHGKVHWDDFVTWGTVNEVSFAEALFRFYVWTAVIAPHAICISLPLSKQLSLFKLWRSRVPMSEILTLVVTSRGNLWYREQTDCEFQEIHLFKASKVYQEQGKPLDSLTQ
jgi:hypothetical protein